MEKEASQLKRGVLHGEKKRLLLRQETNFSRKVVVYAKDQASQPRESIEKEKTIGAAGGDGLPGGRPPGQRPCGG